MPVLAHGRTQQLDLAIPMQEHIKNKCKILSVLCQDICFVHYSILFMFDYSPPLFQIQRLMGMGQPHPLQEERHPLQEELKTKMILSHFHGSNVTRRYLNHNHWSNASRRIPF